MREEEVHHERFSKPGPQCIRENRGFFHSGCCSCVNLGHIKSVQFQPTSQFLGVMGVFPSDRREIYMWPYHNKGAAEI